MSEKDNEQLIEGLVIKKTDYKENSKIVFILTNDGLMSLEAKGANSLLSKNNAYTKVLTKIAFHSKTRFLTTGKVLENYNNIKLDLGLYEEAAQILELCYTLAPHITDFPLFYQFTLDILDRINHNEYYQLYEKVFRIKLLYLLGIAPVLNKCVNCDEKKTLVGFDLEDGGMKCLDCANDIRRLHTGKYIEAFRTLYFEKLNDIDELRIRDNYDDEVMNQLSKFLDSYYESYIGYISKSRKILKEINKQK